jgi:hypothetical protein
MVDLPLTDRVIGKSYLSLSLIHRWCIYVKLT